MVKTLLQKPLHLCLGLGFMLSVLLGGRVTLADEPGNWFSLYQPQHIAVNSSFVSPLVELFGDVQIGQKVFVAGNTVVRADPETRICIGSETNLQDNILFLAAHNAPAPATECGETSSSTEERVSIAHQAIIKNSHIGNFTFVGFHANLNNVVLEEGAFVLHGAKLANVTIGRDRIVPIGAVITTQADADTLPLKTDANTEFQNEVLEVNEEFAEHYGDLYSSAGYDAVTGVSPAPATSWNPEPVAPTLGENVKLDEFVRVVGDVQLGANSVVGQRTSIRADEGAPMIIGENAVIQDRVTFHALKGTSIRIGNALKSSDNVVFHGPLAVGDNLTIGDDAILFRSTVGDNVSIGAAAIVVGVTLPDGAQVPAGAQITTQEQADALVSS
jgi:carbon dioxide concentrating mechanism protein CcmM